MRVVIAVDLTEYAEQIISSVIHRPWPAGTLFKLLTVLAPVVYDEDSPSGWKLFAKNVQGDQEKRAHELMNSWRQKICDAIEGCQVHIEIREGRAREEIITASADWMADKIIIGAHGMSANRLLGVIPRSIASHAHCSVELVRVSSEGLPLPDCRRSLPISALGFTGGVFKPFDRV